MSGTKSQKMPLSASRDIPFNKLVLGRSRRDAGDHDGDV